MKWFRLIFLISVVLPSSINAQEVAENTATVNVNKKLTKEEKREVRWAKKEEKELLRSERKLEEFQRKQRNLVSIKEKVNDSTFVLEASSLNDRFGRSVDVSPSINFIAVSGENVVIQVGSDFGIGPNGMGGITLEGVITTYEPEEGPGYGNINVLINAKSVILGLATITITVNQAGTFRASVTGSWRQQIRMSGNFKTFENSKIFQGRTSNLLYGPY